MGNKTLNDLVDDPAWTQQREEKDELFTCRNAYYLPGKALKSSIKCQATFCKWETRHAAGVTSKSIEGKIPGSAIVPTYQPMILCFTCNRTFHFICVNIHDSSWASEKIPVRCPECKVMKNNLYAIAYFESKQWEKGMKERKKELLKDEAIIKNKKLLENTDEDELEKEDAEAIQEFISMHTEEYATALETTLNEQQSEMSNLGKHLQLEQEEKEKLRQRLEELEAQLEKMRSSDSNLFNTSHFNATQPSFNTASSTMSSSRTVPKVMTAQEIASKVFRDMGKKKKASSKQESQAKQNTSQSERSGPTQFTDNGCGSGRSEPTQSYASAFNIDVDVLDNTQRVLLEQSRAQIETNKVMCRDQRRKILDKIVKFKGEERDWIRFKKEINYHRTVGEYEGIELDGLLSKALEGEAMNRVRDMIGRISFDEVMKMLEVSFGDPSRIINKRGEDILAIKIHNKELYHSEAVTILSKIQAYLAACEYAEVDIINSHHLARHIVNQISMDFRQRCRRFYLERNAGSCANALIDLETLREFLEALLPELDDKGSKSVQVNSTSFVQSHSSPYRSNSSKNFGNNSKRNRYIIMDLSEAKFKGYDMNVVNSIDKRCFLCNSKDHFTVECTSYYSMDANKRARFVQSKNLCRNCVLTNNHRASECIAKPSCGQVTKIGRCKDKHHSSLHSLGYRKQFSSIGSQQKANTTESQPNTVQQSTSNSEPKPGSSESNSSNILNALKRQTSKATVTTASIHFSLNHCMATGHDEAQGSTVKVFKTKFLGVGKNVVGYSVGDSASEATLISEELRKSLNLQGEQCQINLRWADSTTKTVEATKVNVTLKGTHANAETLTLRGCYAVNLEDFSLPTRSLNMRVLKRKYPYLQPVKCESYFNKKPLLLVGSPHAAVIESCGQLYEGGEGKPVGLKAKLGYCVYGGTPDDINENIVSSMQIESSKDEDTTSISNDELYEAFSYFNSLENMGIKDKSTKLTKDEEDAVAIMEEEMQILPNGAIEVPLVWKRHKGEIPRLPNNLAMVVKRQEAHERKLQKNPEHAKKYIEKFEELIAEKYVREATKEDLEGNWPNINYLPMTLVVNQNKIPPSYRIVFDAAARFKQTSLNQNLHKGPDLLANLYALLIQMRMGAIAFSADIRQMFMRMKMCIRDQQCQRVLFKRTQEEKWKTYIVSSVLFGPTCSPFQSQYCKNLLAEAYRDKWPEAADLVQNFMYMDDLIASAPSVEKALELAKQCIAMFATIDWQLVAFQSNSVEFLKGLPQSNVKQNLIPLLDEQSQPVFAKILGVMWDPKADNFVFNFDKNLYLKVVKESQRKPTKREQSSTIARIFDIMGFLSHLIIRGRILLQRSWQNGIDWDQSVTNEEQILWLEWLRELERASNVKIPRRLCEARNLCESELTQLHIFCDAGSEAYAAVAYLVTQFNKKKISRIIMAKAKVTPLRFKSKSPVTEIPRLEMFSALCAARLAHMITQCFGNITFSRHFWSDSEVVLRWIKNPNQKLKAYAVSPIEEILTKTESKEWSYVPTKLNAADLATKFQKLDFADSNSVWFVGPSFIIENENQWPKQSNAMYQNKPANEEINICSIDTKPAINFVSPIKLPNVDDPIANDQKLSRLSAGIRSTWNKLVRAVARALKLYLDAFLPLVRAGKLNQSRARAEIKNENSCFQILTVKDLERAELYLIRRAQRNSLQEAYETLTLGKALRNKEMLELGVFMDDQGVMRINSRVRLTHMQFPQRNSPFLPRENPLTKIFLHHIHCEYQHIHLETQIAAVRAKVWIPQLRTALKSVQYKCNFCAFQRAQPYAPIMAPLPDCRTNPHQNPFQVTGIDCAGPIMISICGRPKKIWILIFSCALTRFIQLQILDSLESKAILSAIATFWSTCGPVQMFVSDRGTNFIGANRFMKEEWEKSKAQLEKVRGDLTKEMVEKRRVEWMFLPAHSPWMGGFYERLIREVKRSIAHVLESKKITKLELNIAIQDACHRINCRPLTHNPVSADDADILTPHHLARGIPGWPYLPCNEQPKSTDPNNDRSVFRRGRLIADEIMRKFVQGYLPVLTKRTKWFADKTTPLKIGDLVLLIEPNMTRRMEWKRGRVIKIYKGKDRKGRVADVVLKDGDIKKARSIQRLAKIEIQSSNDLA